MTGPVITLHMFVGTIVGWAILSPIAKTYGWAPGPVGDWDNGSRGWILWVGLATLLTESFINIAWMLLNLASIRRTTTHISEWLLSIFPGPHPPSLMTGDNGQALNEDFHGGDRPATAADHGVHPPIDLRVQSSNMLHDFYPILKQGDPSSEYLLIGLLAAVAACAGAVLLTFSGRVPLPLVSLAILITLFLAIASIRSMGQTDFSPVSGLGKLLV